MQEDGVRAMDTSVAGPSSGRSPAHRGLRSLRTAYADPQPAHSAAGLGDESARSSARKLSTPRTASMWWAVEPSTPAVRAPRLLRTRRHAISSTAGSTTRLNRSSNRRAGSSLAHRCSFAWIPSTLTVTSVGVGHGAPVITGAPWPTPTEVTVRVLGIQAKLHRWASEDPARRFDDLFNLVVDPAVLLMAWRRVRSNRGARTAGVDGSTAHYIEAVRGVESFLAELRADLVAQQFVPLPAWVATHPQVRRPSAPAGDPHKPSAMIEVLDERGNVQTKGRPRTYQYHERRPPAW